MHQFSATDPKISSQHQNTKTKTNKIEHTHCRKKSLYTYNIVSDFQLEMIIPVPIEAEDGGDGANRNHLEKQSGEHENYGGDEHERRSELRRPVFVKRDSRNCYQS